MGPLSTTGSHASMPFPSEVLQQVAIKFIEKTSLGASEQEKENRDPSKQATPP
jgi:hypothetical protein